MKDAAHRLGGFIQRIENLEAEGKALRGDVKDVYSEAKAAGFDPKILRQVIQRRRMEPADREESDNLLDVYERALDGTGNSSPLGEEEEGI